MESALEKRVEELEKRVAELSEATRSENIERKLATRIEKAFIEACKSLKTIY